MKLSHSKLSCILNNPAEYFLIYREGIQPKERKAAFAVGSAVHWGIEHNTSDLREYFKKEWKWNENNGYTRDQVLAEAMDKAYLARKDIILDDILTKSDGTKLELLEETHEVYLTGKLKSFTQDEPHEFVGIIDLLLLTNEGFIIIDYKTSSSQPNWDDYLEQIYRYIFLIRACFPDIPIIKIGIINLIKSRLRWVSNESQESFTKRINRDYEQNLDLINYHIFEPDKLDADKIDAYILNLSRMADLANAIDLGNIWYINYDNTVSKYGKSQYWDIYYKTPSCFVFYTISDTIYDETSKQLLTIRDCRPLDMMVLEHNNVLNKYDQFKVQAYAFYSVNNDIRKDEFFKQLRANYIVDDELLEKYWITLTHELEEK